MTPCPTAASEPMLLALDVVAAIVDQVGSDRVDLVTFTCDHVSLRPADLAEGEQIARALGLGTPLDHRMFVPGHTLWTEQVDGLEVQARSVLRQIMGTVR